MAMEVDCTCKFQPWTAVLDIAVRMGGHNEMHAVQWGATFSAYVYRKIGEMAVKDVDVGHVLKVLEQKCDDLKGKPTL